eukprot:SAG31_NODE_3742_length_3930_cov_25.606108_3_plen_119_part_00
MLTKKSGLREQPIAVDSRIELTLYVRSAIHREFIVGAAQPVEWTVVVEGGKTIDLSIHHVVRGVHRAGDGDQVLACRRCNSDSGVFFPQKTGTLVFVLDNLFSLITNKNVSTLFMCTD